MITESAPEQMTRGRDDCIVQAEESAEMSILEYLCENYKIERELNTGKYIAEYDRRITFPVGPHLYFNGQLCKEIRSISGYKTQTAIDHWEEVCDPDVNEDDVTLYSQFKTIIRVTKLSIMGYAMFASPKTDTSLEKSECRWSTTGNNSILPNGLR